MPRFNIKPRVRLRTELRLILTASAVGVSVAAIAILSFLYSGKTEKAVASAEENKTTENFSIALGTGTISDENAGLPKAIVSNSTDTFFVIINNGLEPYSYSWSSTKGGQFSSPDSPVTFFRAPETDDAIKTVISCEVTDRTGKKSVIKHKLKIKSQPEPIELVRFTGNIYNDKSILLNWSSTVENDNDFFTISKSDDGINFEKFETIRSKGSSRNIQEYSVVDNTPFAGNTYYKLSQTDFDGITIEIETIQINTPTDLSRNEINDPQNIRTGTYMLKNHSGDQEYSSTEIVKK